MWREEENQKKVKSNQTKSETFENSTSPLNFSPIRSRWVGSLLHLQYFRFCPGADASPQELWVGSGKKGKTIREKKSSSPQKQIKNLPVLRRLVLAGGNLGLGVARRCFVLHVFLWWEGGGEKKKKRCKIQQRSKNIQKHPKIKVPQNSHKHLTLNLPNPAAVTFLLREIER